MKKQWICGMMVFLLFTACRRSPQIEKTLLSSSPLEDVISTAFCQVNVRGEKQIVSSGQDNIRFVIPSFQDCTAVVTFEEEVEPIQVTIQEKSGATFSITAEKEDAFAHVFLSLIHISNIESPWLRRADRHLYGGRGQSRN